MPRRIQYTTSSEREREEKGFRVCQAGIPHIVRVYNVNNDFGRIIIKKSLISMLRWGGERVGDDERKKLEILILSLEHKRVTGKRLVARTRLWGETGAKRSETNFAPRPNLEFWKVKHTSRDLGQIWCSENFSSFTVETTTAAWRGG